MANIGAHTSLTHSWQSSRLATLAAWAALLLSLLSWPVTPVAAQSPERQTLTPHSVTGTPSLLVDVASNMSSPFPTFDASGKPYPHVEVPAIPCAILAFSDHPERVGEAGLLFNGGILPLKPVRLQMYHQGGDPRGLYLGCKLFNRSQEKALVHVIQGYGGPCEEYFDAGHLNNRQFLSALASGTGYCVEIEPGESVVTLMVPLPIEQVVSATQQITLLRGKGVEYGCFATHSPTEDMEYGLLANAKDVHARGFYSTPDQYAERRWTVGDPETYVAIGATRQPNIMMGPELKGDYGVLYTLELELNNPSGEPANVELLFNPRGGKATAYFLYQREDVPSTASQLSRHDNSVKYAGNSDRVGEGGRRLECPWRAWVVSQPCEAFAVKSLSVIRVPAHTVCRLRILTIPEGASNYPARVVIRKAIEEG